MHIAVFLLASGAFLGYFFGVNYPEILRTYYYPAPMTVSQSGITPRYCCFLDCDYCGNVPGAASCNGMVKQAESLQPAQCSASNVTACPVSGPASICDNGYKCCSECCQTCQSCTTSCSGSGSSQTCSTSCSSYTCNCYCCSSTNHNRCQLKCNQCYSVSMTVAFADSNAVPHTANYTQDFGQDLTGANTFYYDHRPGITFVGYYQPSDPSVIVMSRDFTAWKWGVFSLFALLLFAVLLWISMDLLSSILPRTLGDASQTQLAAIVCCAFWVGIVWPFVILLPIEQLGYVSDGGKDALIVLIPVLIVAGWAPAALLRLSANGWRKMAALLLYAVGAVLPLVVLLPLMILGPQVFLLVIPILLLLSSLLVVLAAPWDVYERMSACVRTGGQPRRFAQEEMAVPDKHVFHMPEAQASSSVTEPTTLPPSYEDTVRHK